ncbi:MAG: SDR family NAD(P)-dependent oxidoreductase [Oligoflexales bacterium]
MRKKRCLITGSSKGLGKALVQKFKSEGYETIGVSRSYDECVDICISTDLSEYKSVDVILQNLQGHIDVFVCNAGINMSGAFDSSPFENIAKTMQTNLILPMMLMQAFVRHKIFEKEASCIWISSLASSLSYPGSSVYGASKKGLSDFVEQIEMIVNSDLHQMTVYPGPMDTLQALQNTPSAGQKKSWAKTDVVAEKIFRGMQSRNRYLYPARGLWFLAKVVGVYPYLGEKIMDKTVWEPMKKKAREQKTLAL